MKQIQLQDGFFALVDDDDYPVVSRFTWCLRKGRNTWYAFTWLNFEERRTILFMHHLIMGRVPVKKAIDHIDRNGLNNQKINLRFCNHGQNSANRITSGSSKFLGVSIHKQGKSIRWRAFISSNKKSYYLGSFKSEVEAAIAYNEAATKLHGEYANLNIIPK